MKKGMKIVLGVLAAAGAALAAFGAYLKVHGDHSVGIIGGADGPTAIFIAGKFPGRTATGWVAAGSVLLACAFGGLCLYFWKKKK